MKRLIVACLLITSSSSLFSMHRSIKLVTGHPCLPVSVYKGVYAKLLARIAINYDARFGLEIFIALRLEETKKCLATKTAPKLPCDLMAFSIVKDMENRQQPVMARTVSEYAQIVSNLFPMAVRKKLGVRVSKQTEFETWELKVVDSEEFSLVLQEAYNKEEILGARLVEEIHAHEQLLALVADLASK